MFFYLQFFCNGIEKEDYMRKLILGFVFMLLFSMTVHREQRVSETLLGQVFILRKRLKLTVPHMTSRPSL